MAKNDIVINNSSAGVYTGRCDHLKFVRLLARGKKKMKAKELAGFSRTYPTKEILRVAEQRGCIQIVELERKALQTAPGSSIRDSVEFNMEIRDNELIDPKVRLSADNNIANRLGHNAPAQVQVEEHGLFLHMHGYNTDAIEQAIKTQKGLISDD